MDFAPARPRRTATENIVPMINVVFLLLVFFLMTAQITPPDPFEISPPEMAQGDAPPNGDVTLYLAQDGRVSLNGVTGDAALSALPRDASVVFRADAGVAAARFAEVMRHLSEAGIASVQLVTTEADR